MEIHQCYNDLTKKEKAMTEQTSSHGRYRDQIPTEAREHLKAAREEFRKGVETLFPEGFIKHRRAARREMLMAVRSIIDAALEKTEEKKK